MPNSMSRQTGQSPPFPSLLRVQTGSAAKINPYCETNRTNRPHFPTNPPSLFSPELDPESGPDSGPDMLRKKAKGTLKGHGRRLRVIARPVITVKAVISTVNVHFYTGLGRPDLVDV